ncbi:hypothetical protein HKBW3S43_00895 [Candidatus Hakubella thermalkaliphila]|uniref:Uncharacterized protein n=1 Tax=Candidatus Hakubella thermalkaliphila TaxID=2754717 RepID=A0A6V8PSD8_9ACTN|nr:hypothetical protein HKBW3S43_00895 [Candidatus Hakubella thermalkaliphila]
MRIYSPGNQADREILFLQEVGSSKTYARKLLTKGVSARHVVGGRVQEGGGGGRGQRLGWHRGRGDAAAKAAVS